MNESQWAEKISADRERVAELRARLAAGEDEVATARALGFSTRNDVNAKVAALLARRADAR